MHKPVSAGQGERQREGERYTDTHRDKEGGQMVKRDGAMCEKQQLARVSAVCQSGLNMACF